MSASGVHRLEVSRTVAVPPATITGLARALDLDPLEVAALFGYPSRGAGA